MSLDGWAGQLALILGTFVIVTLLAALLGAANLGTAMTIGTIGFAAAYMWVIVEK